MSRPRAGGRDIYRWIPAGQVPRIERSTMSRRCHEPVRTTTGGHGRGGENVTTDYRLGWRKLWQLRERAEHALGADFDVRDFHELVLGSGALPLTAVEANVEHWITGGGATPVT
jgi:hypothetical protein